jgi:hypothetical protein
MLILPIDRNTPFIDIETTQKKSNERKNTGCDAYIYAKVYIRK